MITVHGRGLPIRPLTPAHRHRTTASSQWLRKVAALLPLLLLLASCAGGHADPAHPAVAFPPPASQPAPTVQPEPTARPATVVIVGDVMLARAIAPHLGDPADPIYPFAAVQPLWQTADLVVANAESPIGTGGKARVQKPYLFRAPPQAALALAAAGFGAVSLANNHAGDFGRATVLESLSLLQSAGVGTFGAGANESAASAPMVRNLGGTRVAFIGFNDVELPGLRATVDLPGVFSPDADGLRAAVAHAREIADFVVVMPHWGLEYHQTPTARQESLARLLIEAGADLVVGAHPHVAQTTAWIEGHPVIYSLGNFAFDGMQDEPGATRGMLLRLSVQGRKLLHLEQIPVQISPAGVPTPAPDAPGSNRLELRGADLWRWRKPTNLEKGSAANWELAAFDHLTAPTTCPSGAYQVLNVLPTRILLQADQTGAGALPFAGAEGCAPVSAVLLQQLSEQLHPGDVVEIATNPT